MDEVRERRGEKVRKGRVAMDPTKFGRKLTRSLWFQARRNSADAEKPKKPARQDVLC